METVKTQLFIGGPCDGEWRDVEKSLSVVCVDVHGTLAPVEEVNPDDPSRMEPYRRAIYVCDWMRGTDEAFLVWRLSEMSRDEMIRSLLDGYRRIPRENR